MHKLLRACVENFIEVLAFPISARNLLKSSAASFLKVLEARHDAISGAELDFEFLVFALNDMSIYLGIFIVNVLT